MTTFADAIMRIDYPPEAQRACEEHWRKVREGIAETPEWRFKNEPGFDLAEHYRARINACLNAAAEWKRKLDALNMEAPE
jgi:hypothetical protein